MLAALAPWLAAETNPDMSAVTRALASYPAAIYFPLALTRSSSIFRLGSSELSHIRARTNGFSPLPNFWALSSCRFSSSMHPKQVVVSSSITISLLVLWPCQETTPQFWHVSFSNITSAMDSSESFLGPSAGASFLVCGGVPFPERALCTERFAPVVCLLLSTSARKSGITGLVDRVPSGDGQVHVPHHLASVGGVEGFHEPLHRGQGHALDVSLLTLSVGHLTDGFQKLQVTLHRGH